MRKQYYFLIKTKKKCEKFNYNKNYLKNVKYFLIKCSFSSFFNYFTVF